MLEEEKLNHYLRFFGLEEHELQALLQESRSRTLEAGEVYIAAGSSPGRLAYISKGLIRAFYLKENGEEVTVLLRWEDQFFAAYDTIFFSRPSRFTYQAMEPSSLLEVNYEHFMELLNASPRLGKAKDYFLTGMLAETMERVESFILMHPEERYLNLLKEKPDIIRRCPDKYIATFLGITPVSLSRIRKRLAGKY